MSKHRNCYNYDPSIVSGNSLDVDINYCDSEIRADIVVNEHSSVRLWGRVVNCDSEPVSNALIKLLKIEYRGNYYTYVGIAHTVSDCDGFYQFDIPYSDNNCDSNSYKILVSKASYGPEKIIPINNLNCDPCEDNCNCNMNHYELNQHNRQ